jgi:hypothetical protein
MRQTPHIDYLYASLRNKIFYRPVVAVRDGCSSTSVSLLSHFIFCRSHEIYFVKNQYVEVAPLYHFSVYTEINCLLTVFSIFYICSLDK